MFSPSLGQPSISQYLVETSCMPFVCSHCISQTLLTLLHCSCLLTVGMYLWGPRLHGLLRYVVIVLWCCFVLVFDLDRARYVTNSLKECYECYKYNIMNIMNVTIMIWTTETWNNYLFPWRITWPLECCECNECNDLKVNKENNSQKTIHMLESCSLMRWALILLPLECCECNACNECKI